MRKLTEEEADGMLSKPMGKSSRARSILMGMKVGDIVLLEPRDWTQKSNPPNYIIRKLRLEHKMDFTCEKVLDGSGWIIRRIK